MVFLFECRLTALQVVLRHRQLAAQRRQLLQRVLRGRDGGLCADLFLLRSGKETRTTKVASWSWSRTFSSCRGCESASEVRSDVFSSVNLE